MARISLVRKHFASYGFRRVNLFCMMMIDSRAGLKGAHLLDFGRTDGVSFFVH